ncbi:hypothetical protein D9619_012782 [Psilocybe cf. subviscida]|uniref:AB hydrolase-1 domain-containing protein n=1 Tax=Psilocybe cf. subviscida TaxID=2480587 RepID=A0A8H5AQB5_9AGAR|nr:hypothetical protein D9619_012782 [Psilocybe cf. subviscida]
MFLRAISFVCVVQAFFLSAACMLVSSSDGTKIYANAVGNPSNPGMVIIHGLMLSGTVFDDVVNDVRLTSLFYLVTYDMRGHGQSDKPSSAADYTSRLFADDFAAVSKAFGLKSPVVVGWSYGGTVFSDIFTNLPAGSVSGLVGIAALPYTGMTSLGVNTPTSLAYLTGVFIDDDVPTYINSKVAFVDSLFNNPQNVPAETKWEWLGTAVTQLPSVTTFLLNRPQDPSALYAAGALGLPLLLMAGTNDKVVLNDVIINATASHFTKVQVRRIQGGSHSLFYDNKDECILWLITFMVTIRQS